MLHEQDKNVYLATSSEARAKSVALWAANCTMRGLSAVADKYTSALRFVEVIKLIFTLRCGEINFSGFRRFNKTVSNGHWSVGQITSIFAYQKPERQPANARDQTKG